ncbi:antitoxin [Dietzia sp. PP-33]|jgi:hypothetical protein|uniref:antitoxin n=1 Tax=Dietzia sp. PP-33 TaxID=2957500 RepID=UPI0029B466CE|nr:antitoxin [Dietzia sp. PP-33]MDX2356299.1 antitoxin [Dietzia sp. PP-33]
MGFMNKIRSAARKNPDKVDSALAKAGDLFDKRTGGKHASHTDSVQDKAGEFLTGRRPDAAADDPTNPGNGEGRTAGGQPPA